MTGTIFSIQKCSVHDGPGIRTTVFFQRLQSLLSLVFQPRISVLRAGTDDPVFFLYPLRILSEYLPRDE